MIDSHCHLDFRDFDRDREEVIAEAARSGVHTMINIGADLTTSQNSVALAEKHNNIYAAVGVHPHDAKTLDKSCLDKIRRLAAHERVVAIGEIGLDFYRDLSPRQVQKTAFHRQMQLAVESKLPVVIHTREALEETVLIAAEYIDLLPGGVFHCFPGTVDEALEIIDLGFMIGIGGVVTYKNSKMSLVAAEIPLEKILLETDAPYLTPMPHRGRQKNQPSFVGYVCDRIAELRGIPSEEVEKITDRNSQKLFSLVETFGD